MISSRTNSPPAKVYTGQINLRLMTDPKQEMCASQNTPVYINYIEIYISQIINQTKVTLADFGSTV
jgi:hypothetical protein